MKPVFPKILSAVLCLTLILSNSPRLSADETFTESGDIIDMVTGDIQTVSVSGLSRVSVTNPEVADISDAQGDKVSLLAKKAGSAVLFLWDQNGKRSIKIRVASEDLSAVKSRVERLLSEANISGVTLEVNLDEGRVVVSGAVPKEDKNRLDNVLQPYSENMLNLVKEEKNEDLIQIDMQVVEISTTLESQLGIQWGASTTATSGGGINTGSLLMNYNETLPSSNGKIGDFFKIGNFRRSNPLEATVSAMVKEGKAKLISKPRLVVVSGKQASFLVGGEIPVNSTTSNTTGSTLTQNTSYTQYGVNMTVTPTIREGKIDVVLNVDIRDVDGSTPISSSSSGSNTAFITRTANTDLLMDNRQTIALAGLIKYSNSVQYTKVPILGNIPVLGSLFRYKQIPGDSNTEMVIILTPTVLSDKNFADSQLAMPTPGEKAAWGQLDSKYEHEALPNWKRPIVKTPTPTAEMYQEMTNYARMVQEKISRSVSYPAVALNSALQGTVKLKLRILKDGTLDSEEIIQSSGNDVLDQDALDAAKIAAPYQPFSTGMNQQDLIFTIPIVYNKLAEQGQVAPQKVIATY